MEWIVEIFGFVCLGACPILTILLGRTIRNHLYRSRS